MQEKDDKFQQVQRLLSGMSDIEYIIGEESVVIKKEGRIFCTIENAIVYLLGDQGEFEKVEEKILNGVDDFLMKATKSYYAARKQEIMQRIRKGR